MKQETGKKSKKWLWIVLAIVAVLAAAAVALVFFLQPAAPVEPSEEEKPTSAVYWNIDRIPFTKDDELGMSTRQKGEDGLIHFRFASDGKLLDLATSDRQLVNYIDTMDACGLVFDADGLIIDALPVSEIAVETAKGFYVKQISGNTVVVNSSIALNGMDITFQLTDGVHVMDVRQETETPGQTLTLEVMDTVSVYGSEENPATSVFLMERSPASEPYLRIDRMYSSATGATTRVPDKDGVYTIPFALNGEILQLKCKDVAVVTEIDVGNGAASVMGLVFDEEGYIIDTVVAATAMRGKLLCTSYDITAINGNSIEVTCLASGNEQGKVVNFTIDENTQIVMNESDCGHFIGELMPELQMGDRLMIWSDADNKAMYITVERRLAPEGTKMYYNFRKQYNSSTQETKRVPNESGYYVFELASGGKVVTVKTKDKAIASKMDGSTYGFFGLKVQGSIVKEYYDHRCVSGGNREIVGNRFVTQVMNPILQIAGVADFEVYNNFMISPTVEIYDCTGYPGTKMGAKTELKVGDRVVGAVNISGEVTHLFVLDRYQKGAKVYYRADTKYDTTTLETTRVPDEEGYYVYTMYADGKEYTFKTKSKEMADYIDVAAPHISLKVSNGIIKNAYSSIAAQMYSLTCFSTNIVESVSSDKMVKCYYVIDGVRTDAPKELKIGKNCQIINVSGNFNEYRGEKTTLKPGDKIVALKNYQTEELTHVWITSRAMQSPPYFHVQRQYADGQTTRVPDENGYYWIEVFADGKIHKFKTKDKDLMSRIDAYGQESFFALRTNGNVVEAVDAVTGSKYATSSICSQFDIRKISGKTITAEKMRPGSSNLGTVATFTYDKNTKIYDVCPYSPNRFKASKLDVGDRINVYTDSDGNITYIFIIYSCERKNGPIGKCSHCNETVWWEPWYGSRIDSEQVVHFYVPTDFVRGQGTVSRDKNTYPDTLRNTVIYDMNGRTLGSTGRNFLVYGDMIIIDSVGGGVLEAQGANDTAIGGNFLVMGGSVSIYDGVTIRQAANPNGAANGGNFYINNLAIKDADGNVTETRHGKVNIYDAVIEAWPGVGTDHFYLAPDSELNIYGGVIKGGTVQVNGTGKITWTGGKMESDLSITGTTLTMPAKPNMTGTLLVSNGGKVDISKMSSDVSIKAMPAGVFTTERNDIDKYLNVFKPAVDSINIVKEGKALSAQMNMPAMTDDLQFVPGTNLAVCPACEGFVNWTPMTQADYAEKVYGVPANGLHLYLTEDINCTATEVFMTSPSASGNNMYKACLHLNGHNLTTADRTFGGSRGALHVMGNGTVTGNGGTYGAVAYINTDMDLGGGIFLHSGTYTKPASNEQAVIQVHNNGGRIVLGADAKIVTEKGSMAARLSGGAHINGNMIISGTIEGGYINNVAPSTRTDGASTYVALVIDGGNVDGGVKVFESTILALSGAAKVGGSGLDLTSGALISASELTEGAEVVVKANGTFSYKLANANEQVKYYKNNPAYLPVEVKDNALWTEKDPNAPDFVDEPKIPAKPEILSVDNSNLVLDANKQAKCPVCNEMVTWVAITKVDQAMELEGDTHYYLANDITYTGEEDAQTGNGAALSYKVLSRIESCLHLNGHNITATNARAIYAGGYLNVMGNGTVSGNGTIANRGATVETNHASARLNLYGGTYVKGGLATVNPIVNVFGAGGIINLYEGAKVDGSQVTKSGTVRAFAGTFNMYGGNVIGGNGNAVEGRNWSKTASGTINIFGGKIEGGTNAIFCGGVATAHGGLGIYGGEIAGTVTFSVDTDAVIAGNPVVAALNMAENTKFTLGEVTEGAAITVTGASGAFTKQCENVDKYAKYFTAAPGMIVSVKDYALYGEKDPTYVPELEQPENINDNLIFKAGTNNAYCPVCKAEVEWIPVTQEANEATALGVMAGGIHYYLTEDVTFTGTGNFVTGPGGNKVGCFHLNGHNLTTTQGAAFWGYPGVMNVMGNGIVTGGKNAELQGAAVGINTNDAGGTINLYGGTYTKAETSNLSSVMYIGANGGKINIFKDVKVVGLAGKPAIDMIGANLVDAVLTVDGAVIEGELKTAPLAGRVKKTVQVNLNGVTVDTVTLNANAKLTLAGDTVIEKLDMASGAKFIVGALGENASIDVAGNGVISEASDNVNTYFDKFTSSYGYELSVVENALVSKLATTPDQPGQEPSEPSETPSEPSEPSEPSNPTEPSEPSEPTEPETPVTVPAYTDDLQFEEGTKKAVCAVCKQLVEWTPVTQETHGSTAVGVLAAGSHYYLAEDVTFTGTGNFVTGPGAGNVGCFHLNGHNVTATQATVFFGYPGVMNVMGNGIVTGGKNAELQGATVGINTNGADGAINLYSGTYTKAETSNLSSVMYIGANGGKISIFKDAKVVGLAGKPAIDMIGASLVDAVLTIDGAEIEGELKIAPLAGRVKKTVQVNLNGVTVDTVTLNANAKLNLAGDTVIEKLDMASGAKFTVGELGENAKIDIAGEGVLTEASDNVNTYFGKFTSSYGYKLSVVDNALVSEVDTTPDQPGQEPTDPETPPSEPSQPTQPSEPSEPTEPEKPADAPAYTDNLKFKEGTQLAVCAVCGEEVEWIPVTQAEHGAAGIGRIANGGLHYYLAEDINYSGTADFVQAPNGGQVGCFHLNGRNITSVQSRVVSGYAGVINILGKGTVTGGANTAEHAAAVGINTGGANGVINLYSGTYTKAESCANASVVYISANGGKINIYKDAKIIGKSGAPAVNILGAGLVDAVLTIDGATVEGDLQFVPLTVRVKKNVQVNLKNVTVGNVTLNENAKISLAGKTVAGKLELAAGALVNASALTEGASITVNATGAFSAVLENAADQAKYYNHVDTTNVVQAREGILTVEKDPTYVPGLEIPENVNANLTFTDGNKAYCPVCEAEVEWTAITQETHGASSLGVMANGVHYYLTEDITYSGADAFVTGPGSGKTGCFHLNGHNVTATKNRVFFGYPGVMNVMGNGTVTGSQNADLQGATIGINTNAEGGTINLYGGTYTKAETCDKSSVIYIGANGGKINLYKDVTVTGIAGKPAIDIIGASLVDTVLIIDGATINGEIKAAPLAGRVKKTVQVTLKDATVDTVTLNNTTKLILAGDTIINKLAMSAGAKIIVAALGSNASIDISGEGVLSEVTTHVTTYFDKFKSTYGFELSIVEGALVSTAAAQAE